MAAPLSVFINKGIPTAQTCGIKALNDYVELPYLNFFVCVSFLRYLLI